MNSLERIKEGCALFADLIEAVPEAFCKEAYAKNELGEDTSSDAEMAVADPSAVSFCMVGGVMAASGEKYYDVRDHLWKFTGSYSPEHFNNSSNHMSVAERLRAAAV